MPALLGLLLLFCGRDCVVPLPGHVLELRAEAADWHWCLRADEGGVRICAGELSPRVREWMEDLQRKPGWKIGAMALLPDLRPQPGDDAAPPPMRGAI